MHLQLQGAYLGERDLLDVPAPDAGAAYELVIEATTTTVVDGVMVTTVYARDRTVEILLDADGSGSFDLPVYTIDEYNVTYTLTPVNLEGVATDLDMDTATVMFRSGDPTPTTVIVDPVDDWVQTGERTSIAATRNHVRVIVLDQYGRPMSGEDVLLFSSANDPDDVDDDWELVPRNRNRVYTTRSNGVIIGYEYSGGATVETLRAGVDNDPEDDDDPTNGHGDLPDDCKMIPARDANSGDVCGQAQVYWADEAGETNADTDTDDMVVHADTDNDKIVVQQAGSGDLVVVDYAKAVTGDAFYVDGAADRGNTYAENLAAFEAALEDALDTAVEAAALEDAADTAWYTLTWDQPDQGRWEFDLIPPVMPLPSS